MRSTNEIRQLFKTKASTEFKNKSKGESITLTNGASEKVSNTIAKVSTGYLSMLATRAGLEYQKGHEYEPTLREMQKISKVSGRRTAESFTEKVAKDIDNGNIDVVGMTATAFLVLTKEWETVGDENVSETHLEAESQGPIPVDEPFQVGNSLMMFPSDESLGAEYKEIVGCRCSAVYN